MSNLGSYQWLTSTAKKFGSPENMLFVFGITLFFAGRLYQKISDRIAKAETAE